VIRATRLEVGPLALDSTAQGCHRRKDLARKPPTLAIIGRRRSDAHDDGVVVQRG
jgi:transposase